MIFWEKPAVKEESRTQVEAVERIQGWRDGDLQKDFSSGVGELESDSVSILKGESMLDFLINQTLGLKESYQWWFQSFRPSNQKGSCYFL